MKPTIIYISSDNRSGSTLLDQLLASHPQVITVGEICHLNAYATQDRTQYDPAHPLVCTCGSPVTECEVWTSAARIIDRPLESIQLDHRQLTRQKRSSESGLQNRVSRILRKLKSGSEQSDTATAAADRIIAKDSFEMFDALAEVTGARYIVDSSKSPLRFRSLYRMQPERMKLILLARDYRAVVHSKMKRGRTLEQGIRGWSRRLEQMESISREVSADQATRVKYETLCEYPERIMRDLCSFIGIEYMDNMLSRDSRQSHHIGGSPSKFDSDKKVIRLDTGYKGAFSASDVRKMRDVAGVHADIWEYD